MSDHRFTVNHSEQTIAGINHLLSDPRYWLHDDEKSALQGARIALMAAHAKADQALDELKEVTDIASEVVDGVHDVARPFIKR